MSKPPQEATIRPARPAPDPYFRFAMVAIGLSTLLRLVWLAGQPIDLYPDEAQYWIWAQHLDWGYYSKPPMVAWMIAASTRLFGETDLAVKSAAPLTYIFTSIVVFMLGHRLYDRRVAAWSAIAFITLPAVSISSIIISTDVPLLLCWAIATYAFVRAREDDANPRWWLVVGAAGGLGLLSKYAMGFWLASALGYLLAFADERRHLRRFGVAFLVSLVIYSPNLAWNWQHGFASYLHTRDNADIQGWALHPLDFLKFVGSQFGVFGPVFFATLIVVLATGRRALADRRTALLLVFTVPTLAIMIAVSLLSRAQPNWSAPAYVTATVLVVGWLSQRGREGLVQWSVLLHVVLAVLLFSARDIGVLVGHRLPGKLDPLHRVRGWHILAHSVTQIRARNPELPMLGDDRELMSALIYYMEPHPFTMAMWNPAGHVRNGFEMNQSLPGTPGGDYFYVTNRENHDEVLGRFTEHHELAHIVVPLGPGLMREVWIYAVIGFKGYAG